MSEQEKQLSEQESLQLITKMINKARESYYDTGIGAIMWGAVIAVCSVVKFLEIHFRFRLPFDIYLLTLVAVIPQVFITIREKKEKKVKSFDDPYLDYIWLGFGIGIALLIFIVNVISANLDPMVSEYRQLARGRLIWVDFRFGEYVSSLFLLLYGMPTFITGAACKVRPMFWGGILCWVCCVVTLYTPVKADLLLTGFSAVMAWLVPGILMEREYRNYKKQHTLLNVQGS